jgi:hypothetical protein
MSAVLEATRRIAHAFNSNMKGFAVYPSLENLQLFSAFQSFEQVQENPICRPYRVLSKENDRG